MGVPSSEITHLADHGREGMPGSRPPREAGRAWEGWAVPWKHLGGSTLGFEQALASGTAGHNIGHGTPGAESLQSLHPGGVSSDRCGHCSAELSARWSHWSNTCSLKRAVLGARNSIGTGVGATPCNLWRGLLWVGLVCSQQRGLRGASLGNHSCPSWASQCMLGLRGVRSKGDSLLVSYPILRLFGAQPIFCVGNFLPKFRAPPCLLPSPTFFASWSFPSGTLPLLPGSTLQPLHLPTALVTGCSTRTLCLYQLGFP